MLWEGAAPCAGAIAITTRKTANAARSQLRRGRYDAFASASARYAPVITSTMMRKAKFLPVMKGKKSELATKKTMNGSAKTPESTIHRSVFSSAMATILARPLAGRNVHLRSATARRVHLVQDTPPDPEHRAQGLHRVTRVIELAHPLRKTVLMPVHRHFANGEARPFGPREEFDIKEPSRFPALRKAPSPPRAHELQSALRVLCRDTHDHLPYSIEHPR